MKDQELAQRLMATFLDELNMHVGSIGSELLALERDPASEQRESSWTIIFRAAHTLKGAAAVVDIEPIQRACHSMEDIFGKYRDSSEPLPEEITSVLLKTVDAIEEMGMRLRAEQEVEDAPLIGMLPNLEKLAETASGEADHANAKSESDSHRGDTSPSTSGHHSARADKATSAESPRTKSEPMQAFPAKQARVSPASATTNSIRVPAQKLDALLSHSGELLVARDRFTERVKHAVSLRDMATELRGLWMESEQSIRNLSDSAAERNAEVRLPRKAAMLIEQTGSRINDLAMRLEALTTAMESDSRALGQTCNLLDDDVYHVRMLPFADACGGLQRAVRDIASGSNKQVKLIIRGADVEVDRSVLEGLKDPLLHLVRNAVDHGIEPTDARAEAGKAELAKVIVSAELRGGQVEVRVEDDGGGLDLDRICDIARKRELEIPDDPREQARLIFSQGFSTAKMITDISGRGVGLDVVQSQVEQLHGAVDVAHEPGCGTQFTLTVPLTLTTIRSMLVVSSGQTFAIPTSAIRRLVRFSWEEVKSLGGRDCLLLGETPTILVSLAKTLQLPSKALMSGDSSKGLAVLLVVGHQRVAVLVDKVLSEREVLVKNLGSRIRRLRHFSGCTLLPTGQIALVINSANVVRSALGISSGQRNVRAHAKPRVTKSLLLVEDSVTTRVLLKNILLSAGYAVFTAADGKEAWDMVQDHPFDIIVTDVDMPRMDGFELTTLIRGKHESFEMPVILVTARGADQDKQRGADVGANAYIVKDSFQQQNLLDTIAQLV